MRKKISESITGKSNNRCISGTLVWNTLEVTNMSGMFNESTTFNQNIGSWNLSKVTNLSKMFGTDKFKIRKKKIENILKSFE